MADCPDCYSQVGSLTRHRKICLVRNDKGLKTWLESIEFWLNRMEGQLNQAYKSITRYSHLGKRDFDRQRANDEYDGAAGMVERVPKLLAQIQGYPCARVSAAQLRASIVSKQVLEVRDILRSLS